jgi:hypothetical protein
MTTTDPTSTTVAIPMHASAPFLDVISANIAALPADVQIILSDRTRVDDALDRLQRRHGEDPRIRFVRGSGVGIIEHYNRLLREADGEYFMWMPHDDSFPDGYVPRLRAALDEHPDANLAFGSVRLIDLEGRLVPNGLRSYRDVPIELGRLSRVEEASYLLQHWSIWIPFRGLMRRREVLRRRLFLRRGLTEYSHDDTWVFVMTVVAPIVSVPGVECEKRVHPGSHSVSSGARRAIDELVEIVTVGRYMTAARVPFRDAARTMRFTAQRGVWRACWHLPEPLRTSIPEPVRRVVRRLMVAS